MNLQQSIKIVNSDYFSDALDEAEDKLLGFNKSYLYYLYFVRFLINFLMVIVFFEGILKGSSAQQIILTLAALSFVKWCTTAYLSLLGIRYLLGQPIDFNSVFADFLDSGYKIFIVWIYSILPYILLLLLVIFLYTKFTSLNSILITLNFYILFIICSIIMLFIIWFVQFVSLSITLFTLPLVIVKKAGILSALAATSTATINNFKLMYECQLYYADVPLISLSSLFYRFKLNIFLMYSFYQRPVRLLVRSMFFRDVFELNSQDK